MIDIMTYLHNRDFEGLIVDKDRFLMKKGVVCVLCNGNNSYEIFKHAYGDICYSFIIRDLKDPKEILTKVSIIDGL